MEKFAKSIDSLRLTLRDCVPPSVLGKLMLGIASGGTAGITDEEADRRAFPMLLLRLRKAENDFFRATSNVFAFATATVGVGMSGGSGSAVTLSFLQKLA